MRFSEEKVKSKCGVDAVHYLSFQRHLLILLVVLTASSLGIILPVNMSGDLLGGPFTLLCLYKIIKIYTVKINDIILKKYIFWFKFSSPPLVLLAPPGDVLGFSTFFALIGSTVIALDYGKCLECTINLIYQQISNILHLFCTLFRKWIWKDDYWECWDWVTTLKDI